MANGNQLNIAGFFTQRAVNLLKQFILYTFGQPAAKSAVLNAVKAVIQADIGNFGALCVIGDVVDQDHVGDFLCHAYQDMTKAV